MRMLREERERKFRSAKMSSNLERLWDFIAELMVDLNAADSDITQMQKLYEQPSEPPAGAGSDAPTFRCKARSANMGANDPQDCNWPVCGCDPYADKVIETLSESGLFIGAIKERVAARATKVSNAAPVGDSNPNVDSSTAVGRPALEQIPDNEARGCGQCGTFHVIPEGAECLKMTLEARREAALWAMKAELNGDWVRENYVPIKKLFGALVSDAMLVKPNTVRALIAEAKADYLRGYKEGIDCVRDNLLKTTEETQLREAAQAFYDYISDKGTFHDDGEMNPLFDKLRVALQRERIARLAPAIEATPPVERFRKGE
jgi:hypothetical protein